MLLLVLRLYSGLAGSIKEGRWNPKGVPAISRLIGGLEGRKANYHLILYEFSKEQRGVSSRSMVLEGLDRPLRVVRIGSSGISSDRLRRLILAVCTVRWAIQEKAKLVYTDRMNVLGAAFASRWGRSTVIRMLGCPAALYAEMKARPASSLFRWAYRSPFSAVIASEDGSKVHPFCDEFLGKEIPVHFQLNGVDRKEDRSPVSGALDSQSLKAVVVGRLEESKGCLEILRAWKEFVSGGGAGRLEFIGDGSLRGELESAIQDGGLTDSVSLLGALPQHRILQSLAEYDVYLSFNRDGQLSNTNLEALRCGIGMILAESSGDDEAARGVGLEEGVVLWVTKEGEVSETASALKRLSVDAEFRSELQARVQAKGDSLKTWEERVSWEINLLEELIAA